MLFSSLLFFQWVKNLNKLQVKLGGEAEIKVIDVVPSGQAKSNNNGQLSLFADNSATEIEPEVELFKPQLNTQIIDTEAKLQQLVKTLEQHTDSQKPVAWDTETTSLETHLAELVGIGCC